MAKSKKKSKSLNKKSDAKIAESNKPKDLNSKETRETNMESKQSESKLKENTGEDSRNLIVGGLVVLLLLLGGGFLLVGLLQSLNIGIDSNGSTTEQTNGDVSSTVTDSNQSAESDSNNSNSTTDQTGNQIGEKNNADQSGSEEMKSHLLDNAGKIAGRYKPTSTAYRRGNDYKYGDIRGGSYIVKSGDTLWQIAEARYGTGYAWVDIDRANGTFPLLRNGQPNNIPVGYNLILPKL